MNMQMMEGLLSAGGVRPLSAAEKVLGASKTPNPGEASRDRRLEPAADEYVPEEPREPSGRYWMGRDEDGRPKIYFDDPDRAADAPKQPEDAPAAGEPEANAPEAEEPDPAGRGAKGPERKKTETWECNTDKVDREIEKLKKEQQELEQRLAAETDEAKLKDLERRLAQVEQELQQKDNDAYRRQHAQVTRIS